MTAIAFDTLAYSKKLRAAGMPVEQADAFTRALQDAIRPVDTWELASRQDLVILRKDLVILRKDLVEEMARQRGELIKWVAGAVLAQTALLVGVIALFQQP